jgi:hypothetical protein
MPPPIPLAPTFRLRQVRTPRGHFTRAFTITMHDARAPEGIHYATCPSRAHALAILRREARAYALAEMPVHIPALGLAPAPVAPAPEPGPAILARRDPAGSSPLLALVILLLALLMPQPTVRGALAHGRASALPADHTAFTPAPARR